jgi:hypothetical protein
VLAVVACHDHQLKVAIVAIGADDPVRVQNFDATRFLARSRHVPSVKDFGVSPTLRTADGAFMEPRGCKPVAIAGKSLKPTARPKQGCVVRNDNEVWSPVVATGGNRSQTAPAQKPRNQSKPLRWVATRTRALIAAAWRRQRSPSRSAPACSLLRQRFIPRSSRKRPPQAPADARGFPQEGARKSDSRGKSPPVPAQLGNSKTGLSRRRSRVRVPSLPLKSL